MDPRPGQDVTFLVVGYEAREAYPVQDSQAPGGLLQGLPGVPLPRNDQLHPHAPVAEQRHSPQHEVDALVLLEAPQIGHGGVRKPVGGRPQVIQSHPVTDDGDVRGVEAPPDQVVAGAPGNGDTRQPPVDRGNDPLEEPGGARQRNVRLPERGGAEEVVHDEQA